MTHLQLYKRFTRKYPLVMFIEVDCPGNPPYAASALIIHKNGLILSVSRKYDFNDLGLAGGKIDAGENFLDACIRETKEETGLTVTKALPIFGGYCGKRDKNIVHWNLTFLCKAYGTVYAAPGEGRAVWVPFQRLIMNNNFKYNSFGVYNEKLKEKFNIISYNLDIKEYLSDIELDETKVER